jgi:CysZ protein
MNAVFSALGDAIKSLFHPKMLSLIIWPMLLASLAWGAIAILFWSDWIHGLTHWVSQTPAERYLMQKEWSWVASYLVTIILVMLLVPVIYVTALVITSVFAMPLMVNHVAKKYFPGLELKHGGTLMGSIWNSAIAVFIFCLLWVVTLPLWLFTVLAAALPLILSAYLNQHLFRYDSLADHASREEFQQILERSSGKLYILGAILGLVQFIPVLNFFSPIYIGLAFIHLCLAELQRLRSGNVAPT